MTDTDVLAAKIDVLRRDLDRTDHKVDAVATAVRASDERLEEALVGRSDKTGSRARSILGKLDNDHARITALEQAEQARKKARNERHKKWFDWRLALLLAGVVALMELVIRLLETRIKP